MNAIADIGEIRSAQCYIAERSAFLNCLLAIAREEDCHIICFNADMMAGKVHARAAVFHAVRSFHEGDFISNTIEMEALLFASGSRQCSIAAGFGVHEGDNNLFVCCIPSKKRIWDTLGSLLTFVDDEWDQMDPEKRLRILRHFEISREEIKTLSDTSRITDLVLERVALLHVSR